MNSSDTTKNDLDAQAADSALVERAREEVAAARALTALVFAVKLDLADKKADKAYERGTPSRS